MTSTPSAAEPGGPDPSRGHRFPREVIAHAVRRYVRFAPSFRAVGDLLVGRGVAGAYETVRRWAAKSGALYAEALRRRRPHTSRAWHLDEVAVRIGGQPHWLWRAVAAHGRTLAVLLPAPRGTAAAARFFRRLLDVASGVPPARITTDELGRHAAALARLPQPVGVGHPQVRSAQRCNDRVEQAHQPTRLRERAVRERAMRRFKASASARRSLDAFSRAGPPFRPGRHRLPAAAYRATTRERAAVWREVAGPRAA